MTKKTLRKSQLPKFSVDEEAARFFETHSAAEAWGDLSPAAPVKLSPALSKKIRERHARRKRAISIRLQPKQIQQAKRIAARKSIGYQTQLRFWVAEGIHREARKAR